MCSKKVDDTRIFICVAHSIYPNLLMLDIDLLTCMSNVCDVHGKYLC
jgi:hypothetical protein